MKISNPPPFEIRRAEWLLDREALHAIRHEVFVCEQRVPEREEWDNLDAEAFHVIAVDADGHAIGCARLLPDGRIGRMAVLEQWRGRGAGSAMLACLIELARLQGHGNVRLHAQSHALGFYQRHGFVTQGEEFMEVDIPHWAMALELK
jgi:predicted GNAT family N-acyltransferase